MSNPRFKTGDIIRYGPRLTQLFRFEGMHITGTYYGEHLLGGPHGAEDRPSFQLKLATDLDLEVCKRYQSKWFENV